MRAGAPVALVVAFSVVLSGCGRPPKTVEAPFMAMGTVGSVILPAGGAADPGAVADLAEREIRRLELDLSIYNPSSCISRLNAAAGRHAVPLTAEAVAVLRQADVYSRFSGGAFDVSVGPLMRLWGFSGASAPSAVPPPEAVEKARAQVGFEHVRIDGTSGFIDQEGVAIDLGGIAKGFAVDVAWADMRAQGVTGGFLLNLGGNMRCQGVVAAGRPWRVGVRNPFDPATVLGTIVLTNGMAVATSGNYERFVTIQGVRYSHIMDPRKGLPARGLAGVTVLAESAAAADALSTTLFVLGPEESVARARNTNRPLVALFVPDRQPAEVWVTEGMALLFSPAPGVPSRRLR